MSTFHTGIRRPRCWNTSHGSRTVLSSPLRSRTATMSGRRCPGQGARCPTRRWRHSVSPASAGGKDDGASTSGARVRGPDGLCTRGKFRHCLGHGPAACRARSQRLHSRSRERHTHRREAIHRRWAQSDASQSAFVSHAIDRPVETFGGLDILVCSAAIHPIGDVLETDEATWDRTFAVNVKSMYLTWHYCVPHLIASRGGSIITLASVQATSNTPGVCAYATTKGATVTFTHTLAVDLAKHK